MNIRKPRAGHIVVDTIPFHNARSEGASPAAGATRQLRAATPALGVRFGPAQDPRTRLASGESGRRKPAAAIAWAGALTTAVAFTAILLGGPTLRDDDFGSRSMRPRELGATPAGLADLSLAGQRPMDAGRPLQFVPLEDGRAEQRLGPPRSFFYPLGGLGNEEPAPHELLPIRSEPSAGAAAWREVPEEGVSAAPRVMRAASLLAEAQAAPKLDSSALIARGDEFLRQSDVVSARLFYRLAVANGSAVAATAMGSTYDPVFLTRNAVRGVTPQPEKALQWYRTAVQLGDSNGKTRSAELLELLRTDAARGDPQARAIIEKTTSE